MAMIKQDKMPFLAEEFYKGEKMAAISRAGTRAGSKKFAQQTDKFLATLTQGFGKAAESANDRNAANKSFADGQSQNNSALLSPKNGEKQVNYYELRCNELQDEIDELHRLINEGHGHDSVLASYIEQVKKKDRLLLERDQKLDDLQQKNKLGKNERAVLKTQLTQQKTSGMGSSGIAIGAEPANETEAELLRMR